MNKYLGGNYQTLEKFKHDFISEGTKTGGDIFHFPAAMQNTRNFLQIAMLVLAAKHRSQQKILFPLLLNLRPWCYIF